MELTHSQLSQQLLKLCKDGCTAEVGVFKSLLDQGADPNIHDEYPGYFPLWCASRYGKRDLVELFLQYKADINLKTKDYFARGETVLHAACKHGHVDVASSLLQHGAVVDNKDMDGQTALHRASNSGHTDVVKLLVDCGAQIDNKDKDGWTALDLASNKHYTDVVKALLASGAHHGIEYLGQQLLKLCKDGCTAKVGVFKSLLDQGVDPNIQDDKNDSHPLWYASRYGKRDLVELFLQYKADVNLKTINFFERGKTALHAACKHGHVNVATLLLHHGAVVDSQDWDGQTALHLASSSGHTAVVKLLVNSGAQLDNTDKDGQTALHLASSSGHTDVVKLLVDSGAQIDNKDKDGWTVLDLASNNDHTDVVKVLLTSGAQHGVKYLGQQLLKLCKDCCTAEIGVFKSLLDQGVDPNIQEDGWTALDLASNNDHSDVVKVLLASGAQHGIKYLGQQLLKLCEDGCTAEVGDFKSILDQGSNPNMHDEDGYHPLWYASRYGKRDLVELFLQYKADVNLETKGFYGGALHAACEHGHKNVASSLLHHGAVVDSQDKIGQTALRLASRSGHTDVVKLLVDSGAQIDNKDKDGWTALDLASNEHHTDVVKVLLASGAHHGMKYLSQQLLKLCEDGCTAEVGVFKSLLDQGADPNMHDDEDGLHPLWYASRYGKRDLVELFLQYKADANLMTKSELMQRRETALHTACKHGYVHVTSLLLKHGAVVDSQTRYGQTALRLASSHGHADVVKLLVDSGAQIDIKDENGHTALHLASRSGHTDVVELLVDYGAQLDNKDKFGLTPLNCAKREGHSEIVSLLEKALTIEEKPLTLVPVKTKVKEEAVNVTKDVTTSALSTAAWDLPGVDVCGEMTVVLHSSAAQQITWEGFGLKLHIDEGSLPLGIDQCTLTIKASLAGQYEFPDNSYLVSAIIWLRCEPMCKFTKPVVVKMQHCARPENVDNLKLKFVRAVCSQKQLPYTFKELGGDFTSHSSYGVVEVNGFSGLAITQEGSEERKYCSQLFQFGPPSSRCIHFIVTWDEAAHLTAVEEEYAKKRAESGLHQPVNFESDTITLDIPIGGISIEGWTITPLMQPMVTKEQVDNFNKGKLTPHCELFATVSTKKKKMPISLHQVNLLGAKPPYNMLKIILPAFDKGIKRARSESDGSSSLQKKHPRMQSEHVESPKDPMPPTPPPPGPEEQPRFNDDDLIKMQRKSNDIEIVSEAPESFMSEVVVLIQTVKQEEELAVYEHMKPPTAEMKAPITWICEHPKIALTLGMFGDHKAAVINTKKGGNCQSEVTYALNKLRNVKLIIAVGFAYGRKEKCSLGDVIVSTTVDGVTELRCENNKINIGEGTARFTEMKLVARTTFARRNWMEFNCIKTGERNSKVHTGVILSSPVLLNDSKVLQDFLMNDCRFIGGEMEGQQLALCTHQFQEDNKREVDFIIIKGVADFGDGTKKGNWQLTASLAAAKYAEQSLNKNKGQTYKIQGSESRDNTKQTDRVVKPGSIEKHNTMFKELAKDIGAKYKEVGIDLGLAFRDLHNALETLPAVMLPANEKALNMLMLWRDKSPDKDFTYSILATALEKNGLQRFADQYCYMDPPGS